jgi:hypothetical protein
MIIYLTSFLISLYTFLIGFNEALQNGLTIKAVSFLLITPLLSFFSTSIYLIKSRD